MIKSKVLAACAALSMACGFAFADSEFSFSNKVSSNIVDITKEGSSDSKNEFSGIKNKSVLEFSSEKVDGMIELVFWSSKRDGTDDKEIFALGQTEDGTAGYDFGDTFLEVRPFDFLGFEFHEKMWLSGSYFPMWDDNVTAGNMGSDFGAVIRPLEGLKIGAGLDFLSVFNDSKYKPVVNFGAEWANDAFALGAAVRNVADNEKSDYNSADGISFGVYGSLLKVEGLVLNAGFGYNSSVEPNVTKVGDSSVAGNLATLTGTYEKDAFHTALEFATNFCDSKEKKYDFYIAATAGYNVIEPLSLDCALAAALDTESESEKKVDNRFQVHPSVTYTIGNHELKAGVSVYFGEDFSRVNFPVHWKYSF